MGLAILLGIPGIPPDLKLAIAVFIGFVSVHLLLLLGTFDIYDLEETEYGNVAVAAMDGQLKPSGYSTLSTDPSQGDALMSGAGRRRRTVWSMELTVVPFFAVLGSSMLALKVWALFGGGLWAAIWFLVARRVTPRAPPWAAVLLFVLPLPLVQRAAISATSITAHLGSSAWHGLSLLLALWALAGASAEADGPPSPRRRALLLLGSGLAAGWGLHCSFSLAPLLLGVVFVAWRAAPIWGVPLWGAATLPGLAILYRFRDVSRDGDVDLITALTGLSEGSAFREGVSLADSVVGSALYWPGFANYAYEGSEAYYATIPSATYGVALLAVIAAGMAFARRAKRGGEAQPPEASTTVARIACWLSFGGFWLTFLKAGFVLDPGFFDGLRYLLPLAPAPLLLAAAAASRLPPKTGVASVGLLLFGHVLGFAMLFQPSVFPAPWGSLAGYEPVVMKAWMTGPVDMYGPIPGARFERWGVWSGISAARRGPEEAAELDPPDRMNPDDWRHGLGIGLALTHTGDEPWPYPTDALLLEGAAWGTAYAGCSTSTRKALLEAAEDDAPVWYGIGRADLYCRSYEGGMEEQIPAAFRGDYARGLEDAWVKDYAPDAVPLQGVRPGIRIY